MAEDNRPGKSAFNPDAIRRLGRRIRHEPDPVNQAIEAEIITEIAASGSFWVQLSARRLAMAAGVSIKTIRRRLKSLEAEGWIKREHRNGKPALSVENRGDFYAPADREDEEEQEPPARAGPIK